MKNSLLSFRIKQFVQIYFKPISTTPLPQALLPKMGAFSWFSFSLLLGFSPYLLFCGLAILTNTFAPFSQKWWYSLIYPVITTYVMLLAPLFKSYLTQTLSAFFPLLPPTPRGDELKKEASTLRRNQEWQALGFGLLIGWLLGRPWELPTLTLIFYNIIGEGLMFGLLGWYFHALAHGTRLLIILYDQTNGLSLSQSNSVSPVARWTLFVTITLLIGVGLSTIFIGSYMLMPINITLYVIIFLGLIFIFLSSDVSPSLMAQFRILRAIVLFTIIALIGTLGYHSLEGWDFLDGLYMTIITLTTIGYGEIGPLSDMGRVYTIILSIVSIGIGGYALSAVAAFIVEGDFNRIIHRKKMDKKIAKLNNHIILCGVGRVGTQIAVEFYKTHTPFVIVDADMDAIQEALQIGNILYVNGDATKDETLHMARIEEAKGIVAALPDDKENAFTVLSARALNPELRIVARLTEEENAEKLRKVGANEIVSTNLIGGMRMASVMLRPTVVNFLDEMLRVTGETLRLEEVSIEPDSYLVNKTLAEAQIGQRARVLVVAIKPRNAPYMFNPGGQTRLNMGDVLIVMGSPEQLEGLRRLGAT